MTVAIALALFFICWWIALIALLPVGVRSQHEQGDIVPGSEHGAPVTTRLLAKAAAATVIAAAISGGIYWLVQAGFLDLDTIPFLPRFESPV